MALSTQNLHKLISRSKNVANEARKTKLTPAESERPRKNPIFKLSSSKAFQQNVGKELRINTLPDIADLHDCFGPDYETPKFKTAETTQASNNLEFKKDDFFSFGFAKKQKTPTGERIIGRGLGLKGKENKENKEEKDVKALKENGKELKKKFLSTINFGTGRERIRSEVSPKRAFV